MSFKGKKNVYRCTCCNSTRVTIDRDEGVTPFLIRCETRFCNEMMQSNFYRVDQDLTATHEWYSPDQKERRKLRKEPAVFAHIEKGGLLLRKIEG